jgi:His-Xaa-Ser system protein HxsD
MVVKVSKSFYSEKAVLDAVYWLSKDYCIQVESDSENYTVNCSNSSDDLETKFLSSLNDFNLREKIAQKTGELKSLIIAKAYYPDLISFGDIGGFDDPIEMDKKDEAK